MYGSCTFRECNPVCVSLPILTFFAFSLYEALPTPCNLMWGQRVFRGNTNAAHLPSGFVSSSLLPIGECGCRRQINALICGEIHSLTHLLDQALLLYCGRPTVTVPKKDCLFLSGCFVKSKPNGIPKGSDKEKAICTSKETPKGSKVGNQFEDSGSCYRFKLSCIRSCFA